MTTAHEPTLTVFRNGTPIFTSSSKWLHPLFELEVYLADHAVQPENLILQRIFTWTAFSYPIVNKGVKYDFARES